MSLERNISNQCSVEQNLATAGFGSIVGHASPIQGGPSSSFYLNEHQGQSRPHYQQPQMLQDGSLNSGLEQVGGGGGDSRGMAEATSVVAESATCFDRHRDTYQQLGSQVLSGVTCQPNSGWQGRTDQVKTAHYGPNDDENKQRLDDDIYNKGRTDSSSNLYVTFPGNDILENKGNLESGFIRDVGEAGSCKIINQNEKLDRDIEQEDICKERNAELNSKILLNLDNGIQNDNRTIEDLFLHYDDLNISNQPNEFKNSEMDFLTYQNTLTSSKVDEENQQSPKYLQDYDTTTNFGYDQKMTNGYDLKKNTTPLGRLELQGTLPIANDHDYFQFDQPKITLETNPDYHISSPTVKTSDAFGLDKQRSEDLPMNLVSNMDILGGPMETPNPISFDVDMYDDFTFNSDAWNKIGEVQENSDRNYSPPSPNFGYPANNDEILNEMFAQVFDEEMAMRQDEISSINDDGLSKHHENEKTNEISWKNPDEVLYVKQNETFTLPSFEEQVDEIKDTDLMIDSIIREGPTHNKGHQGNPIQIYVDKSQDLNPIPPNFSNPETHSTQKKLSLGNPIPTQPNCSGQHLAQENPHRTRSTAIDTTQTAYNKQFLPSFFQMIEAPGAQEAPNVKDFLKRKELTYCPGKPGKSCSYAHKDVIQLLRHYSLTHYDTPQNGKLQPSSPHFCHTCSDTFMGKDTWKRHLITMTHLSRTFISMFLQNCSNTQENMHNKEHDAYLDRLTFLDSRELDRTPNNLIEVLTVFIFCVHHKAREYFKTSTILPTIKEFGSIRKNIIGYIRLSNIDYTNLPNTTLKRKGANKNGPFGRPIDLETKETKNKNQFIPIKESTYTNSGEGTAILTIDCSVNTLDKESEEAGKFYERLFQSIKVGQNSYPNHEIHNGIQGRSYTARCRNGYKRNTPCLDLYYNTNSRMELENIKIFFNNLYKHIKASKFSIAKKMTGEMKFISRKDESDVKEFIPQVDGGDSPPPDSDYSDEHEEDTINNSDGIDTVNTIFETGYDSEKSFTTGATIHSDPRLAVKVQVHEDLGEMIEGRSIQKTTLGNLNRLTNKRKSGNFSTISSIQSNIAINTLTIRDFQKIEAQIDPDSLKRFTTLREKYENRRTAFELSNSQLNMYRTMAGNPDMIPIISNAESITEKLKDDISNLEKNLHSMTNKKNNVEFLEPIYGTKSTYLPTILGIIQTLAPGTNRRVKTTWNYIANIITTKGLNKEAGRNLLGAIVKGEMVDIFELYSHLCGREIAIKLSDIFDTPLDKAKYLDDLQKFQKRNDENFGRAISRLHSILIGIETQKRPGERTMDKDIQMRHHLRQMTGDKIYFEILKEERSNAQEGRILTIEQLAKRCDLKYLEALERKRPDLTINLHTLSMGENAPLRNASKFVERENREHNTRQRARTNQDQLFDSSIDNELLEATQEQTDSMEWEAQEEPKEQNRKPPLVATKKLLNNNTDKNQENNSEKRNTGDNSHHQDKTTRDQKNGSYSNVKQTSWTGNKGSTNAQQSNYSYDNDRNTNTQQQGNRNATDKHQNQPSTSNQYQGQNSYRGNSRQRFSTNQEQPRFTAPTNNRQNQYEPSNWRGGYNERYGYGRGYRQGPGRRDVVRYIASPQILYDQLCANESCHTPQTQVHHRLECPKLKAQDQQGQRVKQPQNQEQGF